MSSLQLDTTVDSREMSMEQVIVDIDVQRTDPGLPWGFQVRPVAGGRPYIIHQVTEGSSIASVMDPGDVLLKIFEKDVFGLSFKEVEDLIDRPLTTMNLQILKGSGLESQQVPRMRVEQETSQCDSLNSDGTYFSRDDQKEEDDSFWENISRDGTLECENGHHGNHTTSTFPSGSIFTGSRDYGRVDSPSDNLSYLTEWMLDPSKERQGDITFWELEPESEPALSRSASFDKVQKMNSLFSNTCDTSTLSRKLAEHKSKPNLDRIMEFTPHCTAIPPGWKCMDISVKSGYQKTVSTVKKTYSTVGGVKSLKTYEHVNQTTKKDKTLKTVDGKEEVTEKTENNKEYVLENKDEVNGRLKETKKVINEYSKSETISDGDSENCLLINERLEENVEENSPSPRIFQLPRSFILSNRSSIQPKKVKYVSELKIELKGNSREQIQQDSECKFTPNDQTGVVQSPISERAHNCDQSVTSAKQWMKKQNENKDRKLPPNSEFKNKVNFFSEMSRKLNEDNRANHLPRSSNSTLSEGQKPTSSDYSSSEEKSQNDVSLEETKGKNIPIKSTNVGGNQNIYATEPSTIMVTKPQTNFNSKEDYLNFNGPFRKQSSDFWLNPNA